MRSVFRLLTVAVLAALVIIPTAIDFALPWHPWASYGFTVNARGRVTSVDPLAARAGLRTGDRILAPAGLTTLALPEVPLAPDGNTATLRIAAPGGPRTIILVSHAHPRAFWDNVTNGILTLAVIAIVTIAAMLVLLRPRPATWAFFVLAVGASPVAFLPLEYLPANVDTLFGLLTGNAGVFAGCAFFIFALRFPDVRLRGRIRWLEPALVAASLLAAAAISAGVLPGYIAVPALYAPIAGGSLLMIWRLKHAPETERVRLRWIFTAFTFAWIPTLVISFAERVLGIFLPLPIDNIAFSVQVIAAVAVAYTILKHRLFDIRFIVTRAAVFSSVSLIVIGVFMLAEALLADWLREASHATTTAANAIVALSLGFSLRAIHSRVDGVMDNVFFRAHHENVRAIERFARDALYITDAALLVERTIATLRRHMDATYVTVRTHCAEIENDPAFLRIRATHEPVELHTLDTGIAGDMAFPMTARGQLLGIVVLGPRESGESFAPDEVEAVGRVAHSVAGALEMTAVHGDAALQRIEALLHDLPSAIAEQLRAKELL